MANGLWKPLIKEQLGAIDKRAAGSHKLEPEMVCFIEGNSEMQFEIAGGGGT